MKTFQFVPGMSLRVVDREGEPWFVAKDVCAALGMDTDKAGTGAYLSHLDANEVGEANLHTLDANRGKVRGNPVVKIVNESGLYSLILKSRKPEAKAFKRWITGEVLPSIRKTGGTTDRQRRCIPLGQTHREPSPSDTPEGPYWSPLRWS